MHFTQKALLFHRATFDFGERALTYRIDDEKACAGFTVPYENIGADKSLQSYREKGPIYMGLILLAAALGCLLMPPGPYHAHVPQELAWAFIGAGWCCLIAARFMRFDTTVVATPLGRILVFDRADKDRIIAEIQTRRTAELRRKYLEIDFLNDPQHEIGKYRWLKDEGVISAQEFENAIARITAARDGKGGPS